MPQVKGHLPMEVSLGRLPPGARIRYTHINNTNPAGRASSPYHRMMAHDGLVLDL
jgi:hypothetical protein